MSSITVPAGVSQVLLHACCAPCSSAIVEWLLRQGVQPIIYYYNPNIWPREEYRIRKEESKRHAETLGIKWIDDDYDHESWRQSVCGLEDEPERGRRCEKCFAVRLLAAARKARELGIPHFATTLASSRWKSLEQIERAGRAAEQAVGGVSFWAQNWRKGGLQERRNQLLKAYGFYNQQYCGCEFSARNGALTKPLLRQQMRDAKHLHSAQLSAMSQHVVEQLAVRLADCQVLMGYWPLADEVDIRPLLNQLVRAGRTIVLPKVVDDEQMELRRYRSEDDLVEGAFHILEPAGEPFLEADQIEVALVPGMAFDAAGHRLGRGRGYYDRFLSAHPRLRKIGVCFPFQRVAEVPTADFDVSVDEVCG